LRGILLPIYNSLDKNTFIRYVAETYVYTNPRHADFFVTSVLGLLNASASIGLIFYWQLKYGSLPWWLIAAYYFSWVGTGGRMMGAAYALAHKEVSSSSSP
jgi:ABC-type multidrug transport system permease subunit